MADVSNRLPRLYIAACILCGIGIIGLGCIFILQLPWHIFEGLLYVFLGVIAFGIGEILNHPKSAMITVSQDDKSGSSQVHRRRSVCSLGNICDIAALLLFFIGLSDLLFPR